MFELDHVVHIVGCLGQDTHRQGTLVACSENKIEVFDGLPMQNLPPSRALSFYKFHRHLN